MKTFLIISIALFSFNSVLFSQQWSQTAATPEGAGITDMVTTSNGTIIVTCASYNWPTVQGGIRHSTNSGTTWVNNFQHYTGRTLTLGQNGYVFGSSWDFPANSSEGLWVSSNHGVTWGNYRYLVGSGNNIFSILVKDNNQTVFLGTRTGVLKSTDGGYGYIPVNNGIPSNTFVYDLEADSSGTYIAAGTSKGLYVTSNNGSNWNAVSGISANDTVFTVKFTISNGDAGEDNLLFSGTSEGEIFKSSPGAQYLTAILIVTFFGKLGDIQVIGNNEFTFIAAAISPFNSDYINGPGVSYSSNSGNTWNDVSLGLATNPVVSRISYRISGGNINWYAGLFNNTTNGAKIYKMTTPIGINQISNNIPEKFSLFQNYPNPFNPMTRIKFNIAKASNVNITVFDLLGRHITTLVNEKLGAGSYETEWSAVNMPGGVYFYKIETESYSDTKKMILIK